jgi:predicted  nucleic acid-binding Zn-ribbon protein
LLPALGAGSEACHLSSTALFLRESPCAGQDGLAAMKVTVAISAGELFDKISILEIKLERIQDGTKRVNVSREHAALVDAVKAIPQSRHLAQLKDELKIVNSQLWRIEDDIRAQEKAGTFGREFVALARSVYRTNDRRAALKHKIDALLQSDIIEEKSYVDY